MKTKTLFALAVEIGFAGILAVAQTAAPPAGQSTNATGAPGAPKPSAAAKPVVKKPPTQVDSVIQLVKGGMSEAFIIKYLQKNNKPVDLTPADMIKLKEAGVSETIMGVMMDPASAPAPAAATPAPVEVPAPVPVPVNTPPPPPVLVPVPEPVPATPAPKAETLAKPGKTIAPGDWRGSLDDKIQQAYPLTQLNGDKSDIVTPGAILMLKKSGLVMYSGAALATANTYKAGKITQNILGAWQKNSHDGGARTFVRGEKFWITQIEVKDDGLSLQFISDPLPEIRYHSTLKFPWDKKTQPNADEIVTLVAEVLQNVGTVPAAPPQGGAAPAPPQMAPIPPPPAPDSAMAPIPPPSAPAPSIEIGQTKDQIVAALGQPDKIANVGTKQILYFKNLKVTLVNGKVTAIE